MTETLPAPGKPRWTTLATFGLLLVAAALLLFLIAALFWGLEGGLFFLPIFVVIGVTAFLVWRFGTWAKIVGAIIALLAGFMLFWTAFGLFSPSSFFDFVPGALVLPGALIALTSCIASIVAKRRGHYTTGAERGERRAIRVATAIAGVLALVSALVTIASRSTVSDATGAEATSVLEDFEFVPKTYSVAGGSQILVKNNDPFLHTFTVDALGIDVRLSPGSSKLVSIPATPGTYVLYCEPHGDPTPESGESEDSMNGTLTVT